MSYTFCAGGTVLLPGARFDFGRVLAAYERVIDAFSARFPGPSTVSTSREGYRGRLDWRGEGRESARETWLAASGLYEAVDEPLVHRIGGFTVKAYLLGKTWCVYHRARDLVTTPEGRDVSDLDPSPVLCFYGAPHDEDEKAYGLLDARTASGIAALLGGPLASERLETRIVDLVGDPKTGERLQVVFADFPHGVYGDGVGPIRIRCVEPGGMFVEKNTASS